MRDAIKALDIPIDVLLCNAGIMALPKLELANGVEQQFNTNHLGHFILVHNLLESVKRAEQGRIVMLSSLAHKMAPSRGIDFDNLDGSKYYNDWKFYGQSKLANLLTAVALAERLEDSNATANAIHPGIIRTNLSRSMGGIQGLIFNNPITGWVTGKLMGSKNHSSGGLHAVLCRHRPLNSMMSAVSTFLTTTKSDPSRLGQDVELANRLWDYSCEAVKDYI